MLNGYDLKMTGILVLSRGIGKKGSKGAVAPLYCGGCTLLFYCVIPLDFLFSTQPLATENTGNHRLDEPREPGIIAPLLHIIFLPPCLPFSCAAGYVVYTKDHLDLYS